MDNILQTLNNFGLFPDSLIPDGNIHRCSSNAKSKKNLDGWYGASEFKNNLWCVYGCWVRGEQGKYSTLNGSSDANHEAWKELEEQRQIEALVREREGQEKAQAFINECTISDDSHKYLKKKQIPEYGRLRHGKLIVIPLYNSTGGISSYQTIDGNGRKQFMSGGIVGGCCHPIQGDVKIICICEGYATGASIHAATGCKVLVALNAGNLIKVARTAKEKFPDSEIIICADNDHTKEKNVGLETGQKVASDMGLLCAYPTNIKGSDFNDMAVEQSRDGVRHDIMQRLDVDIMTCNDINSLDRTLKIPDAAIPEGLIREGVEASGQDIEQYTLPLVLTAIARAISGKISFAGHHPNIYHIKVGGTSTGKSEADKLLKSTMDIENFFGLTDMASGPGLLRGISKNTCGMGLFDEVSSLFMHYGASDQVRDGKIGTLLELYSASGSFIRKVYGDAKNTIEIENPCFSFCGNATPTIFDSIKTEDFETGLMQRIGFWMYEGPIPYKKIFQDDADVEKMEMFIQKLRDIMDSTPPQSELANLLGKAFPLDASQDAKNCLQEYSEYIIDAANAESSEGRKGIISRKYESCVKYALNHHGATADDIYSELTYNDVQFGILLADMMADWKLEILESQVVSGDFHKSCEIFKSAIFASMKSGRVNPTFKYMSTRRIQLKNWEQRYSKEVIEVLKRRKEVITKDLDGITRYYLAKK